MLFSIIPYSIILGCTQIKIVKDFRNKHPYSDLVRKYCSEEIVNKLKLFVKVTMLTIIINNLKEIINKNSILLNTEKQYSC
jgi:hypothetical protein